MNIDLGDYVITSDSQNFILNEKSIISKGKNAGKSQLVEVGYYGSWKGLSAKLLELEILSADVSSLQDINNVISHFEGVISDKLSQLSGVVRPSEQGA